MRSYRLGTKVCPGVPDYARLNFQNFTFFIVVILQFLPHMPLAM